MVAQDSLKPRLFGGRLPSALPFLRTLRWPKRPDFVRRAATFYPGSTLSPDEIAKALDPGSRPGLSMNASVFRPA